MTDKEELRRLAQAASPGPWEVVKDHHFPGVHGGDVILGGSFCDYSEPSREDEEFIAAANPAVVLELLDEIELIQSELMEQARLLGMSAERELKLLAEIEQARRTAEYWKSEHLAGNAEIERLRAEIDEIKQVEFPRRVQKVADGWRGKVDALRAEIERQKARYALLEESYNLLRTEIETMKRQKPAAWMCPDDPDYATAFSWKPVACELASCLKRRVPLYLAPGAQTAQSAQEINDERT